MLSILAQNEEDLLRQLALTDISVPPIEQDIPNIEKQDMEFEKWFRETCRTEEERRNYIEKHLIPDVDLSFEHFDEFFEQRDKRIVQRLKQVLGFRPVRYSKIKL